jgi:hypothetical protein
MKSLTCIECGSGKSVSLPVPQFPTYERGVQCYLPCREGDMRDISRGKHGTGSCFCSSAGLTQRGEGACLIGSLKVVHSAVSQGSTSL